MPTPRKPRPKAAAPKSVSKATTAPDSESKAAAAFRQFKEASAAAAASRSALPPGPAPTPVPPPMPGQPPPFFSLPGSAQGWAVLPQPGVVQPAPLAMGPIGERLGSTLRLGIDVLNMALAGSLRLLGGMGYGGEEPGCGCQCGCGGHSRQASCCGGCDCCDVFERDCCTPSVGSCCH